MPERKTLWSDTDTARHVYLHAFQTIALLSTASEIVFSTGQGSGKTSFMPVWISYKMYQRPNNEVLIVEPTAGMLERVAIPEFLKFVKDTAFEGGWVDKRMGIYKNDFGTVYFVSAEAPEHIQGIHAIAAVMDEAGQCSRKAYQMVRGRLNTLKGQLLILTNPYRNKDPWLYREVYQLYKNGDPDILFFTFSSLWNPAIDREKYEKDKARLPADIFNLQWEGIYSKPTGLVFDYGDDVIKDIEIHGRAYAGMDFGVGDPTVMEVGIVSGDHLHLVDEYYKASVSPSEHAEGIARLIKKYNIETIFYDPSALAFQKELDKALREMDVYVRWEKAKNDIVAGIRAVAGLINSKKLTISPNCRHMIDEDAGYVYDGDLPIDANNHCEDARRYLVMGVIGKLKNKKTEITEIKDEPWYIKNWKDRLFKKKKTLDWVGDYL